VGIYGACYKLSLILTIFIQTFRYAAEPFFFAHSVEKDARQTYARVMNYFVIACLAIFLFTMMNMSWIKYFIGKAFWEGLHVVPVLMAANLCLGIFFNLSIWYKLGGRTQAGAAIAIAGAAITIVLNLLLIPEIGYAGSAWATLICYASMMVISYAFGQRFYPVPYQVGRIFSYVLIALVFYLTARFAADFLRLNSGAALVLNNALVLGFLLLLAWVELRGTKPVSTASK
jgi:O-antigen/teichoic acid export membrane protein